MSRTFYAVLILLLLIAATVAGVVVWNRDWDEGETAYVPRQAVITPEVELLREYVRIDTSNPPGKELAGADFLVRLLQKSGVKAEIIESSPGRANVYARIRGRRSGEGLLLLHHIDVVPTDGEGWKHPPFEAKVALNMIWGRGTLDMKSIGICEALAFISVATSGRSPERDVIFLATADEEEGSLLGMQWLLEHRPDIFEGVRYALNEGGVTEVVREDLAYFAIEIGSKQLVRLRVRSSERAALEKTRIFLEPRFSPRDPDRITPEVRQYFRAIAPRRKEGGEILADVDRAVADGKFWSLAAPYRALTQNNLYALGIEQEAGGGFGMTVYLQNLPDEDPSTRIRAFREMLADRNVTVEVQHEMGPTRISSAETSFYRSVESSVQKMYGQQVHVGPMLLPYATTDCRYLRARGVDCYGLWPFPVDYFQSTGIHGADERIRLDWFMKGVELTRTLVLGHAGL